MFIRPIQKKDSSPRRTKFSSSGERIKDVPESALTRPIQSGRKKGRLLFQAFTGIDLVLGAAAGGDHSLPIVRGKSRKQFEAGANPVNIFWRFPESTGNRIPCKMEQKIRPHLTNDFGGRALSKQVQIVPGHSTRRCRRLST